MGRDVAALAEDCTKGHSYAPWSPRKGKVPCWRCGHVPKTEPCGHYHGRFGCTTTTCYYACPRC